ncbi:MAG: FAD-dependent oxidoreductase [Pseudonocardia sp. SCN 72-86]|nr:MAG: FAD-dependent oxidoreductase [Pseudonocardia sp. SCN 72-86]
MDNDVIVVGAGAAGLRATTDLHHAGCDVVCLEARDRVGGRLLSIPTPEGVLDLGATWFWDGEHRVADLAAGSDAAPFPQDLHGDTLVHESRGVRRLRGNLIDQPAWRFGHGAAHLTTTMADALPTALLRTDSPVRAVRSTGDAIVVESGDTTLRARHVVIAVPPALALSHIDFGDALPDALVRLARATPVWMGAITKVVAVYERPFWRAEGLAGAALSRVGPLQEIHDMTGPDDLPAALFGFSPPQHSGASQLRAKVTDQLRTLFGTQAAAPVRLVVHDWRHERWTSPPGVETLLDHTLFGHPAYRRPALDGRLFWASTETAAAFAGHIEGALAAGEAAAAAVLASRTPAPQHTTATTLTDRAR